jgi:hypothetical protein
MLKPLTLTISLAFALCLSGVSRAGDLFHSACVPSEQNAAVAPAPQSVAPTSQCAPVCEAKPCHFSMPHINICEKLEGLGCSLKQTSHNINCGFGDLCKKLKPKPPCYTYEWVLKKKRVHGGCGQPGCETCGGPASVYPTSQVAPAPQGPAVSPAPQAYGSVQVPATASIGGMTPAPAPMVGDEAPPAPEAPRGPTSSLLFSTPSGN